MCLAASGDASYIPHESLSHLIIELWHCCCCCCCCCFVLYLSCSHPPPHPRAQDMEAQRREVTGTFDEVLRVREMEGRRREEEIKNNLRECESRLSEAMGQMEMLRGREADMRAAGERDRAASEEAERALRQTRWACEDQIRVSDGKLQESIIEREELKKANTQMAEEYERKMGELLSSLHEVEKAFVEQRTKHEEENVKMQMKKDETVRKQREKLEEVVNALNNKLSQSNSRAETLERQLADDRSDSERRVKEAQERAREESAAALAKICKAEEEAREAKNRAWAAETECSNELGKLRDYATKERELTVRVEELRTELAKADGGVEEARRLSKDRLAAMQREHEKVVEKLTDAKDGEVAEVRQQFNKAVAEKKALENKAREAEDEVVRLKAEVHGVKMRMRFGESTAPIDTEAGVFAQLNQPSPMFSDDMGPATPLIIDSIGEESSTGGLGGVGRAAELKAENQNLREMISLMRKEMENLTGPASKATAEGGGEGGVPSTTVDALEQQLVHAREYIVVLQGQDNNSRPQKELELLRRHVKELTATIDDLKFDNERLARSQKSLRGQTAELEHQLSEVDGAAKKVETPSQATLEAEARVKELEGKLLETNNELKAMAGDKDRLLDLSNKLRVDMMRDGPKRDVLFGDSLGGAVQSNSNPSSRQLAEVIGKTEAAIAAKYEAKITDIESSLRSLSEHNKTIRSEMDKWGGPSTTGMHIPSPGGRGGQEGGGTRWEDDVIDEQNNPSLLQARKALLKAKEELNGIGVSAYPDNAWGEYGTGIPVTGTALGGGEGGQSARPTMLRSGSGYSGAIMTDSQREAKERLARSQRRRVELLGERRKVRNWNIKDGEGDGKEEES